VKRSLCIYSGIGLTMLVGWYLLLFIPLTSARTTVQLRAKQAGQQLVGFQQTMIQLPMYLETQNNLMKARVDLNDGLYARDQIIHLFDLLTEQAKRRGLRVVEISPPVEELLLLNSILPGSDQPPFLNLTVTVVGGYVDFGKYVQSIEVAEFYRGINRCLITATADEAAPTTCTISFRALLGSGEVTS
jgi:hypothetical protein